MFEKLTTALNSGNADAVADALAELPELMGKDWLSKLKASAIMPDATQKGTDFKDFIREILLLSAGVLSLENDSIKAGDVAELSLVLLTLSHWFRAVDDRLQRCKLFTLSPARQLMMVCAAFEDQSRLLQTKLDVMLGQLHAREGVIDPRTIPLLSVKTKSNTTGSLTHSFDAKGESLELCLKYLFWKHKGRFGEPETHIDPYYDPFLVGEVVALADIQNMLTTIWTVYRFKEWYATLHNNILIFDPPSRERYMLEEASIDRLHHYFTEFGMAALGFGVVNPRRSRRRIDKIASRMSRLHSAWLSSVPVSDVRAAIEEVTGFDVLAAEALNRQYKDNPQDVMIGPNGRQVILSELLLALKFMHILGEVHQQTIWRRFNDSKGSYEHLCPILTLDDLAAKLSATGLLDVVTAKRALALLVFNPRARHLEIWQQPLIPWDKQRCLFLPSLAVYCDAFKFIESNLAESGYSFADRGPILEDEIRKGLRKHGRQHGVGVAPRQIKFLASDGKQLEIDILASFRGHVIVGEAKCVKTPTEIGQSHKAWPRILEGIAQLQRVRKLLRTDWQTIREHSQIDLPEAPPDDSRLIMVVLTNVFTYTGQAVDDIPICDEMAFLRYFHEGGSITVTPMLNGKKTGETRVIRRIWAGSGPTPSDLVTYLRRPPQVEMVVEENTFEYQPMVLVDDKVKPVAFLRVVPKPMNLEETF